MRPVSAVAWPSFAHSGYCEALPSWPRYCHTVSCILTTFGSVLTSICQKLWGRQRRGVATGAGVQPGFGMVSTVLNAAGSPRGGRAEHLVARRVAERVLRLQATASGSGS